LISQTHLHPERFVALVEQVSQGDLSAARSNFYTLLPMIQQMFRYPNPGRLK
jgi:4-hydroxy-tetrahydrodipicolinate synthase